MTRSGIALASAILLVLGMVAPSHQIEIDPEFLKVTCGSLIKLTHVPTNAKLHSHKITYGAGSGSSGQQSVTGFPSRDDNNSYWLVEGPHDTQCERGQPVQCGSTIRLMHAGTDTRLHSHLHRSPLSGNQEVSAYPMDAGNPGDNWKLVCVGNEQQWLRETRVQLVHSETGQYLQISPSHMYSNPIPGQFEVSAIQRKGPNTEWSAQEGIYFPASEQKK
ncbi:MIR motif-containing protein [Blastocladiella britannica]|nr:MIR motif-containing protein [Blastocladiella britannica]